MRATPSGREVAAHQSRVRLGGLAILPSDHAAQDRRSAEAIDDGVPKSNLEQHVTTALRSRRGVSRDVDTAATLAPPSNSPHIGKHRLTIVKPAQGAPAELWTVAEGPSRNGLRAGSPPPERIARWSRVLEDLHWVPTRRPSCGLRDSRTRTSPVSRRGDRGAKPQQPRQPRGAAPSADGRPGR